MSSLKILRFGDYELDESLRELRRGHQVLDVSATPMRLLSYLIAHRDRIVGKLELMEHVWPEVTVSDTALSSALKEIRRALDDDGVKQRWIQTRRGQGYRFVGSVASVDAVRADEPKPDAFRLAPTRRRVLFGAPPARSMYFLGRDRELAELEALLATDSNGSVYASIEGLAGAGKTELALQLAFRLAHAGTFPGGIFWLDAEDPELTPLWGGMLSDQLRILEGPPEQRTGQCLALLEEARQRLLIILDNVSSWRSSERPHPLPSGPMLSVLVTTRARDLGGTRFRHVHAGALPRSDAERLVRVLAGRDPGTGLDELLDHLDGHALALELAGSFLATYPGETAKSYLDAALQRPRPLERDVIERVRYEQTVDQALRTVWHQLSAQGRTAWLRAACFGPVPASRALASYVGLDQEALRTLERLHLTQSDADGSWTMHRLTQAYGRTVGSDEERADARRSYVQGCLKMAQELQSDQRFEFARAYVLDRPHFDAALAWASEIWPSETSAREAGEHSGHDPSPEHALSALIGAARVASGNRAGGCALLRHALVAAECDLERESRTQNPRAWAQLQIRRAGLLWQLGNAELSPPLLEAAAEVYQSVIESEVIQAPSAEWGDCQHELGGVLMTLGTLTWNPGPLRAAVEACRNALRVRTREFLPKGWSDSQSRLAVALARLGECESNPVLIEEAVGAFRASLELLDGARPGPLWVATHANLGSALCTLGTSERSAARLREAIHAYQAALSNLQRDDAPMQWATLQSNVATAWTELGKCEGAPEHFEQAVAASRQALLERTRERVPLQWAASQLALGMAQSEIAHQRRDAQGFEEAADLLAQAVEEVPVDRHRALFICLQEELGKALGGEGTLRADASMLDAAVSAYRRAQSALDNAAESARWSSFDASIRELLDEKLRILRGCDFPDRERAER